MRNVLLLIILLSIALLNGCTSLPVAQCPADRLNLADCPPLNAVVDKDINNLYASRTWVAAEDITIDPIKLATQAKIPVNNANTKVIGHTFDDALDSISLKIWLLENAQHTIDMSYYIFARDRIGYALLGAMCNAVKRGVDVRIMVDALGSFHPVHEELRALETCGEQAGFMRNFAGNITTKKARVQVVLFNSFSKLQFNRRSHDKILIVDGAFTDKAVVLTGGRNISLHYYGIHQNGTKDPDTFRDLELLIKSGINSDTEEYSVGKVSEAYYGLLFLHKGNSRIRPRLSTEEISEGTYEDVYIQHRKRAQRDLLFLKNLTEIKKRLAAMPSYLNENFHESKVRLSHQLSNLTNDRVATDVEKNLKRNPNSILYLLRKASKSQRIQDTTSGVLRIVSPYLFSGLYKDDNGNVIYDGTKETLAWLAERPNVKLEVITNSVMTGDNIFTQSIIDMDMAPRYLLTPKLQEKWLEGFEDGELNSDVVDSDEWQRLINHPQVFIYQTGKLDAAMLGGDNHYGKLHAKFIIGEKFSFIGTSNFDYRSNLYNNEMGFFIESDALNDDLNATFEALKKTSYRWGTPEWLAMRKKMAESNSAKGRATKAQRIIFKMISGLGLEYLM